MAENFFARLRSYYLKVAAVLRGEAQAALIFPNGSDIGSSREKIYAEFLRQHTPSKCNVFFGGFLFGQDGSESHQLDVIVTTDTTPQFNFYNADGNGKSFSPVDGTSGVASIKSSLNKQELENALSGVASIPGNGELNISPMLKVKNYDDWPYKIIYASDGISEKSMMTHLEDFYQKNAKIPFGRRPNVIHVSGKYVIFRVMKGMSVWDKLSGQAQDLSEGSFHSFNTDPDLQGLLWVIDSLQSRAAASTHILFSYGDIINQVNGLPSAKE